MKTANIKKIFIENLIQISAIVEKDLKLKMRFKTSAILNFITPILAIILPLIIMRQLFTFTDNFGPWNEENFMVFQFVTYQLFTMVALQGAFSGNLQTEKVWHTLQAIIIAPFNRSNLLIGTFFSHFIFTSTNFLLFFGLCYFFYPISFLTILGIFLIYFLFAMIFGGIGLIIGIFAVSKEGYTPYLTLIIRIIFMFSCISLPFEYFPGYIQNIIDLNPLYYFINLARLVWVENNIFYTFSTNFIELISLIGSGVVFPIIGIKIFNYMFKKYGISGY
jgi:ABC-type polysaccharide/polyol phosphate export permease